MSLPYEQVTATRLAAADWALSAGLIRTDTHALIVQVLAAMKGNRSPVCTLNLAQMSVRGYRRPGRPPDLPMNVHLAWVQDTPDSHRRTYGAALAQAQVAGFFVNDFNADRADSLKAGDAHFTAIPGIRPGRDWNSSTTFHFRLWSEGDHMLMLNEYAETFCTGLIEYIRDRIEFTNW